MTRWKAAFVTGGCSGIGLGLAERLVDQGTGVAVFDLTVRSEVREALGKRAGERGVAASFHEVDVRQGEALECALEEATGRVGRPDLAIHSAGVASNRAFASLAAEEFERVVAVNLLGSRNFAAAALSRMEAGSRLALISSLAGFIPNYGYAAYNASKFGVVGLAGALRLEYAPRGIGVSVVCPPEVETPMVATERAEGDPVGLALKQFAGTLGLDPACDEIVRGLVAGRWMIVPGRRARLARRFAQLAPGLANAVADRMVARALRGRR